MFQPLCSLLRANHSRTTAPICYKTEQICLIPHKKMIILCKIKRRPTEILPSCSITYTSSHPHKPTGCLPYQLQLGSYLYQWIESVTTIISNKSDTLNLLKHIEFKSYLRFEFISNRLLAVWPQISHLISLRYMFLICNMKWILTLETCRGESNRQLQSTDRSSQCTTGIW